MVSQLVNQNLKVGDNIIFILGYKIINGLILDRTQDYLVIKAMGDQIKLPYQHLDLFIPYNHN